MSMTEDQSYTPYVRRSRRAQPPSLRQRMSGVRGLPALLAVGVVLAALALGGAIDALASNGRVHPGVTVATIEVGGRTPSEAARLLATELPKRAAKPVVVTAGDHSWTITAEQAGISFDATAVASTAMSVGRQGLVSGLGQRLRAWFGGVSVNPSPTFDPESLDAVFDTMDAEAGTPARDAKVAIKGTDVSVVRSAQGTGVRRAELTDALKEAFLSTDRTVTAALGPVPPTVTDEAAAAAADTVETMLAAPVTVSYEGDSWEFQPDEIARWVSFRTRSEVATASGEASVTLEAYIDPKKASEPVLDRLGAAGRPAKDAEFKVGGGEVTIIPSQDGLEPDVKALSKSLTIALSDPEHDRSVALRMRREVPELTTEEARSYGIKERISTYTTTFDPSNKPRVNNIHLLADAIDGTLVAPGEVFSFNGAVGPRTAEKGYQEAPAIVQGKLVPQLGGGICQVGTTLFNAIFYSGLPVVERHNHSFYISHYPKGRDATVSWGGPDLKFRNDTDHWILVATGYTAGSVTMSLYGTDPGYEVTAETGEWTDIRPFKVEEIQDPTMLKGARSVEDSGVDGRTIVVKRIVKLNGRVVREDSFRSVYRPKTQVVRVGTKEVPGAETTSTPAAKKP